MTQAGFFPGMIIYFSLWYRKKEQTMRIALLFAAGIVASGIGCMLVGHNRFSRMYYTSDPSRHIVLEIWMAIMVYTIGNGCS